MLSTYLDIPIKQNLKIYVGTGIDEIRQNKTPEYQLNAMKRTLSIKQSEILMPGYQPKLGMVYQIGKK